MELIKKTTENKVDIVRAVNTSKGGRTFYSLDLDY